jgi:hypothetical protein
MFLAMDFNLWNLLKTTATIWYPFVSGLTAGLIAAFVVHLLTQSRERERWILDCKKQEFKELQSAVAASWQATDSTVGTYGSLVALPVEEQRRVAFITQDCLRIMRDRLYITNDLPLDEFAKRWSQAVARYAFRLKLDEEFMYISGEIIAAANRCVPKTSMQRLKFWKR